ncbi:MAG TPA: hypothetical protein VGC97_17050 [Pyrinomonadaceae bacterium]
MSGVLAAQEIPKMAVVLEKQTVTPARQLVLWMPNPTKHPRETPEEIYTCPDETRGHYYSGIVKVSLVDLKTKKLINTIEIQGGDLSEENTIDLPYLIHRGYYKVPQIDKNKEGKPVLMNLKDYNADGKPFEFALFDAEACMGLPSTLIGYSAKQDRVIQYQTELKTGTETAREFWVDYLFTKAPNRQGVRKYEIDYRGRAGTLDRYEIRYDREREMFYGTLVSISEETENRRPDK